MDQYYKSMLMVLVCFFIAAAAACGAKKQKIESGLRAICGNAPPGRQHVGVLVSGIDAYFEKQPVTATVDKQGSIMGTEESELSISGGILKTPM